jgi:hypothetical protein
VDASGLSGAARAPIPGPGPGPGVALLPRAPGVVKKTEAPFFPSRGRGPPAPARSDDASFPLSPLARPLAGRLLPVLALSGLMGAIMGRAGPAVPLGPSGPPRAIRLLDASGRTRLGRAP